MLNGRDIPLVIEILCTNLMPSHNAGFTYYKASFIQHLKVGGRHTQKAWRSSCMCG